MFAAHPFSSFAVDAAEISYIASAIRFGVGVNELKIEAGLGNAQTIVVTYDGRRIHHEGDYVALARFSQERHDAVIGVVEIDPIESFVHIVELPERWLALVNVIQMLHQPTHAIVSGKTKELPVKTGVVVPFVSLTKFAAHEEELFTGMAV